MYANCTWKRCGYNISNSRETKMANQNARLLFPLLLMPPLEPRLLLVLLHVHIYHARIPENITSMPTNAKLMMNMQRLQLVCSAV